MKRFAIFLLVFTCLLVGCKKKNNDAIIGDVESGLDKGGVVSTTPTIAPTVTEEPINEIPEGYTISRLTGTVIPEEKYALRPIAVQFNNLKIVGNQWGIGQASILYEAIVEGGITRLLGVFDDLQADRIGSIRSSRHYFVSIADEYDAIYVHFGKTKYAIAKLKELNMNNLDGMESVGSIVFYRDTTMKAPHNAFTSLERIQNGIAKKSYRTEFNGPENNHFGFYTEDTDFTEGTDVNKITLKYSSYTSPYLIYNAETKLYERYQFDAPHIDSNTEKQLAFKNVIVQFVKEWDIDRNDYQTMDIEDANGSGYYITNGKMTEITWVKKEADRTMSYYDKDGNQLRINPGKTFISLFPVDNKDNVVLQ